MLVKLDMKIIIKIILYLTSITSYSLTPGLDLEIFEKNSTSLLFSIQTSLVILLEIGIGNNNMSSCDVIYFQNINNGSYLLSDSYSNINGFIYNDSYLGGVDNFFNLKSINSNGLFNVTFERLMITNDTYDFQFIYSNTPICIYYNYKLNNSRSIKSGQLTLIYNSSGVFYQKELTFDPFFSTKGFGLTFFWIFINYFGFFIVTFCKNWENRLLYHRIFSGGTAFLTILFSVISILLTPAENKTNILRAHDILGYLICGLSFLQFCVGNIIYHFITNQYLESHRISKLKIMHKSNGIILILLSHIEILLGFGIMFKDSIAIIIILIIIYHIAHVLIQIIFVVKEKKKTEIIREYNSLKSIENLEKYDTKKIQKLRENKKIVFSLYDNYIVNLTKLVDFHPGGPIHFQEPIKDLNRYLNGTYSINEKIKPHNHLLASYNYLFKSLIIGIFSDDNKIIIGSHNTQERSIDNSTILSFSSQTHFIDYPVKLVGKRNINNNLIEFQFILSSTRQNYKFSKVLPGFSWVGRHFSVSSRKLNKTRLYSICLSLNSNIVQKLYGIIANVNRLESGLNIENMQISDSDQYSESVELYIKKYNMNAFSDHLDLLELNSEDIYLKGPIGLGLEIEETVLNGIYIAFGGGTGNLSFIDFFTFTLKYIINTILEKKIHTNHYSKLIDEDFSNVSSCFKFIYFSAFRDEENSFFHDLCERLNDFSVKYNLNTFKFIKRYSKVHERWTQEFIKKELIDEKNIRKVWISGPQKFNNDIKKLCLDTGLIDQSTIVLV